jgi:hypothetical protein
MNPKQRLAVILGVSAIALTGLVPPWHHLDGRSFVSHPYRPIWLPPRPDASIDPTRLLIVWVVIALIAGSAYVMLKRED